VQGQLRPLWRQVRKGAGGFGTASVEDQHRLRKRIKRLRYALEAAAPVLKRKPTQACLRRLRRALQALGELNDLQVAEALYRQLAVQEPRAWFAVGYLAGQRTGLVEKAARTLKRMRDTPPF
jgi:CHAD domain-containing protein